MIASNYNIIMPGYDSKKSREQDDNLIIYLSTTELREILNEIVQSQLSDFWVQAIAKLKEQSKPEFLDISQTAEILHASKSTINRWADIGLLTKHRLGSRKVVFNYDEVIEFGKRKRGNTKWRLAS
jgi:excisionase family DNA binding protein